MLRLIGKSEDKRHAQSVLEENLVATLIDQECQTIRFRPGGVAATIYSAGGHGLWATFVELENTNTPRFWNAFGVYRPNSQVQRITVEINIPTENNNRRVAGFFAEDPDSKCRFLMHSGGVGGGQQGVGLQAFLQWSELPVQLVQETGREPRQGIMICEIQENDPQMIEDIWTYVRTVQDFKNSL